MLLISHTLVERQNRDNVGSRGAENGANDVSLWRNMNCDMIGSLLVIVNTRSNFRECSAINPVQHCSTDGDMDTDDCANSKGASSGRVPEKSPTSAFRCSQYGASNTKPSYPSLV